MAALDSTLLEKAKVPMTRSVICGCAGGGMTNEGENFAEIGELARSDLDLADARSGDRCSIVLIGSLPLGDGRRVGDHNGITLPIPEVRGGLPNNRHETSHALCSDSLKITLL